MRDFLTFGDAVDSVTSPDRVSGDDWSVRLARDAFGLLKSAFPNISHYQIRVLHNPNYLAFTVDGHHIFLTRTMLELCGSVERAAFVIAHEIAHHELGHVPRMGVGWWLRVAVRFLRHTVTPFERARWELEADAFAIDMCLRAGLSGRECLWTLQIFEKLTLDRGGIEAAFGGNEFYGEMSPIIRRCRIGLYLLRRAYYPVRIRRIMAERHAGLCNRSHKVFLC